MSDGGVNIVEQDGMVTSGQSGDTVHDNRQAFRFTTINTETPVKYKSQPKAEPEPAT